ncbi:MAG: hypothetical protein IPL15_10275 [Comamonadaceae bacterium]|uniref:hypothetical protein n=1 Tax=Candidatus Skiveiella danica TaxID=3386177 RepID=UPI00390A6E8C|nr:hypothetical protein [Comamonadaceae bacterium]
MSEELNQEQLDAAMDAEFEKGFHVERGEEVPEPEPEVTPEPEVEVTPEPAVAPEPEVAATPALAGLTEEQITTALARVSQQQATIDKLGGRIGHLIQQVEQLKSTPRTVAEQRSFDLKLTRLTENFPELAEILREDLKDMGPGEAAAPAAAGPTFTAEDVDKIVTEKLTAFQHQQERAMEVKVLGSAHPDWEQVIKTPQFAIWRDNVIADGKELMESENAAFISRKLTEFKDWAKTTVVTAPVATPPAPAATNRQRLANAVLPRTAAAQPAQSPVTEEDAFMAAFKAERSKSGY